MRGLCDPGCDLRLCVVERLVDVRPLEVSTPYRGRYFVLVGRLLLLDAGTLLAVFEERAPY